MNFFEEASALLPDGAIIKDAPMKDYTTFKIGGAADYLIFPHTESDIRKIFRLIKKYGLPSMVLGNCSNVLVRDKGIRGAVVKFGMAFATLEKHGETIVAGAGALLKDASEFAAAEKLSGLEFAVGIPGSIGGAVFMNAGAYDGEMKSVVAAVKSVTQDGEIRCRTADELDLSYRHSVFQENGEAIFEVTLKLALGDEEKIRAAMADYTARRENKQPLSMPSAGSTFKRPKGYFAGTLIDQTGLKGFSVGGAQVSDKHAGFVVNKGNATASDVLQLIAEVQKRVYAAHGVKLYPEVRVIGEE